MRRADTRTSSEQLTLRLSRETVRQLELEAEHQTKSLGIGFVVSRTDVLRQALAIGLAEVLAIRASKKRRC